MVLLLDALDFPGAEQLGEGAGQVAEKGAGVVSGQIANFVGDPKILLIGLGLVVLTVVIIFFLRKIIINSVLGIAAWAILVYVFEVDLPLFPSFVLSAVFGLAGIGCILVLKFLGIALPGAMAIIGI